MSSNLRQWGGTAILATGSTTGYAAGVGQDPTKLGRWCWARYRGKHGRFLRIFSVYCPTPNSHGQLTVYAQHRRFLQAADDDREPRSAFFDDLGVALRDASDAGDLLIVCGDLNQDVLHPSITTFFTQAGLRHLLFSKHNPEFAPATYSRNTSNTSIDGIWASHSITLLRGGYLDFDTFPGNHCPLWFDISYNTAFGHTHLPSWRPQIRRLQLRDPRCVKRYNQELKKFLLQHQLPQALYALESTLLHTSPTEAQITEANRIDTLTTAGQLHAEAKCRRLHMGSIQFSEATSIPRKEIFFWQLAISRRKGHFIHPRRWQRAKKAARVREQVCLLDLPTMATRLKDATTRYRKARKDHLSSRLSFIEGFDPKHRKRILQAEEQL